MSLLGWIIAIVGIIVVIFFRTDWSKLKRLIYCILWIIFAVTFSGGNSSQGGGTNPYYQKGYEYGFEEGSKDERFGNAYSSRTEQLNESRYNFFRKYSFNSENEKSEALQEYIEGYQAGYAAGWED